MTPKTPNTTMNPPISAKSMSEWSPADFTAQWQEARLVYPIYAALATQFALTEGLPAAGIAVVAIALARVTGSRLAMVAGVTAAVISVLQFCLGMWLAATSSPVTAHVLFQLVNRMDGGKMLVLAVLGAAAAAAVTLPRWLRYAGAALAVAITASGVVYLLLLQSLELLAGPALVLLLIFITGAGIWLGGTVRGR